MTSRRHETDADRGHDERRRGSYKYEQPRRDEPYMDRHNYEQPRRDEPYIDRCSFEQPRRDERRRDGPYADQRSYDGPRRDGLYADRRGLDEQRRSQPYAYRSSNDERPRRDQPIADRCIDDDRQRRDEPYSGRRGHDQPRRDETCVVHRGHGERHQQGGPHASRRGHDEQPRRDEPIADRRGHGEGQERRGGPTHHRSSPYDRPPVQTQSKGSHVQLNPKQLSGYISRAQGTHEILHLYEAHGAVFNHIHAANAWNKLGKQRDASDERHEAQLRQLLQDTLELIPSCNARAWANIVHGIAKCKLRRGLFSEVSRLFTAVGEAAVGSRLRDFKPQELANTAWAFATAGVRAEALFAAVAEAAVGSRLRGFKPQNLANTVWAFTAADVQHTLLDECTRVISRSLCTSPGDWPQKLLN